VAIWTDYEAQLEAEYGCIMGVKQRPSKVATMGFLNKCSVCETKRKFVTALFIGDKKKNRWHLDRTHGYIS
jgi:hypothetical protein